ncbi:MAG: response regulator [Phycisphaerales bacterium]|nr:response regulator [Phycisphaerae bacterium]NNF44674.1 response regulator [Phycisphaerales bacterium]NNM27832.1 response regulator [Phycisphaerales bacterium]
MSRHRPRDLVRLTPGERNRLLNQLDREEAAQAEATPHIPQRRWEYRRRDVAVSVEHPAGGVSRFLVCSRNLSDGGISFLHGGFLFEGSHCRVVLPRFDGSAPEVTGRVRRCCHVERFVHDVEIEFDEPIEPQMFVQSRRLQPEVGVDTVDLPDLNGAVLFVDLTESDLLLLAHQLQSTDVELTVATDRAKALEELGRHDFEMVLCDLNLRGDGEIDLLTGIRDAGFDGPIVLVTAETDGATIRRALESGADHMLSKPYDPVELFALMYRLKSECGPVPQGDLVYSTMESQPGMAPLITRFVEESRQIAGQLRIAADAGDLDRARGLCLNLKGNAAGIGFASLSHAAAEVIALMDGAESPQQLTSPIRRLGAMCDAISLRSDTAA